MPNPAEIRAAYYGVKPRESRFNAHLIDFRDDRDNGTFHVRGYASVTDSPYTVTDWLGDYTETISRGAFSKSLQERDDVRLLINHDGIPLARTASGTLALREVTDAADDPLGKGNTGLFVEADLDSASPLAQTLRSAMARGDVSQMSFAFQALRQEWNEDYTERTINEVRMFDVSAVAYPASPTTTIELDSADMAELVGRVETGKPLSMRDREMFREIVSRISALDDTEEREIELVEVAGYLTTRENAELLNAAHDAAVNECRQNKLDALKRRYTR